MPWHVSKEKKTVGIDPRNPSVADIIANAYSQVLNEGEKHPVFRPISDLPYSKEQIAIALMTDSLSMRDPEFTRAAGACYVHLAGFLPDEDAAIAASLEGCPQGLIQDHGNQARDAEYARLRSRHAEIVEMFNEELNRLNHEWQAFLVRNGLEETEDMIPRAPREGRTARAPGPSVVGFEPKALQTKFAAEQGDAAAQCQLGWRYLIGEGVPQDYAEAAKWLRKAAGRGRS